MTGRRGVVWWAVLAVAGCGVVATTHGLYEVARACGVGPHVAGLYVPITDGLALAAYAATTRLARSRWYAWTVVVAAAGLSGLAQGVNLTGLNEPPSWLRFGVGYWPAVAVAVAAHLLWLVGADEPAHEPAVEPAVEPAHEPPSEPADEPAHQAARVDAYTPADLLVELPSEPTDEPWMSRVNWTSEPPDEPPSEPLSEPAALRLIDSSVEPPMSPRKPARRRAHPAHYVSCGCCGETVSPATAKRHRAKQRAGAGS